MLRRFVLQFLELILDSLEGDINTKSVDKSTEMEENGIWQVTYSTIFWLYTVWKRWENTI